MTQDAAQQLILLKWALAVVMLVNVGLLLVWAYRTFFLKRSTFAPRWSAADIWFGVQLTLLVVILLSIPLFAGAMIAGLPMDMANPRMILYIILPGAILQNAAFFGVPAGFINLKYGLPLRAIGLPRLPTRRDVVAGVLLGILGMAISLGVEAAVGAIASHFTQIPWVHDAMAVDRNNPVMDIQKALPHLGIVGAVLGVLAVGVSAPLGEEMLFRGFAFNALKRRFGLAAGLILSALLFTLPHSYGLGLVPVFALGLLLAWSYQNSGSLWVPILIHLTNNTTQVLIACFFPQAVQ